MELHKDSGQLRVIIDVSYESKDEFINFIENEQCQFIESLGVDGLKKFEWYINEETNTATLIMNTRIQNTLIHCIHLVLKHKEKQ